MINRLLKSRHRQLLSLIIENGICTGSEAAPELEVSTATVSRLALRLVAVGYLSRVPDPEDMRMVRFVPTRKGREYHAGLRARMRLVRKRRVTPRTEDTPRP